MKYTDIVTTFLKSKSPKPKIIVIYGPTGAGKTQMSIDIAKFIWSEIISTDSKQIYRGMDIGTGKITFAEMSWVPHHMLDIRNPDEVFSAGEFKNLALPLIDRLYRENKIPLLVGGTGLYINSLIYNLNMPKIPANEKIRKQLDALSTEQMYELFQEIDPKYAAEIHPNNRIYIERAIEVIQVSWISKKDFREEKILSYEVLFLTPSWPFEHTHISAEELKSKEYRNWLYERINLRVEQMFEEWLLQEVESLLRKWYTFQHPGMRSIGYQEFELFMSWEISLEEVKIQIQQHSRNYAKRQLTWFVKYKNIEQ